MSPWQPETLLWRVSRQLYYQASPREHDVYSLPAGRSRYLRLAAVCRRRPLVRDPVGLVFFAGEIFSLFPAICTDPLWQKVCDRELRNAVHRQGHGRAAVAVGQCPEIGDWRMARGILRGGDPQHRRRSDGASCFEAPATEIRYAIARLEIASRFSLESVSLRFGAGYPDRLINRRSLV
jgi:hypothetical protein